MIKKTLATVAVAASAAGVTAVAATPAAAVDDTTGIASSNGDASSQVYGNTTTGGYMSPNMSLVNGSLNKPCIALPPQIDLQNVVGLVNVGIQDLLTSKNQQVCTENSSQVDGDDPLSNIDIPILSGIGAGNF